MTKTNLSEEIDTIRSTANSLLAFKFERRSEEQWSKFWGCLDTLRDMDDSILELLELSRKPTRLECIGFLQVLVSQQDAIFHLSKCVGLKWKPSHSAALETIRDLRNRITSHSAWSDRHKDGASTSMLNWSDIQKGGFKAVLYRENKDKDFPLYEVVEFEKFVQDNLTNLRPQIIRILKKMKNTEATLHEELRTLDWKFLDNSGDGYLREKMWSPWDHHNDRLWQAKSHAEIFLKRLDQAGVFFGQNKIYEFDKYEFSALIAGIQKLILYLEDENPTEEEKLHYYVLLIGWVRLWDDFDKSVVALKEKIGIVDAS